MKDCCSFGIAPVCECEKCMTWLLMRKRTSQSIQLKFAIVPSSDKNDPEWVMANFHQYCAVKRESGPRLAISMWLKLYLHNASLACTNASYPESLRPLMNMCPLGPVQRVAGPDHDPRPSQELYGQDGCQSSSFNPRTGSDEAMQYLSPRIGCNPVGY